MKALVAGAIGLAGCASLLRPSFSPSPPACEGQVCIDFLQAELTHDVRMRVRAPAGTRLVDASVTTAEEAGGCGSGSAVGRVFVDGVLHRQGPVEVGGDREVTLAFAEAVWEALDGARLHLGLATAADAPRCLSLKLAEKGER